MAESGSFFGTYSNPRPFVVPTTDEIPRLPPPNILLPRETLHYFGGTIEQIMSFISTEYSRRALAIPTWKRYLSSLEDFIIIQPTSSGENLNKTAVKWFPQYIKDIQDAIDVLLGDARVPDTRSALMARIFTNNQGMPSQAKYTSKTKLQDGVVINVAGVEKTINPLSNAKAGSWPISFEDIRDTSTKLGVTPDGTVQADLDVESGDFPQSVIGTTGEDGIGGISAPMTSANRPNLGDRLQTNPVAVHPIKKIPDRDQGYGHLGHLAHAVQQVRYQPPMMEWFPQSEGIRFYSPNAISVRGGQFFHPSLFTHPVTELSQDVQNWGFWLKGPGTVGFTGSSMFVKADTSFPHVVANSQGECPFPAFFPPPEVTCRCTVSESAFAHWWSKDDPFFMFDNVLPVQDSIRGGLKFFNRNTRLKVTMSTDAATIVTTKTEPSIQAIEASTIQTTSQFKFGIKTARIGLIDTVYTFIDVTQGDINLMEAINAQDESYDVGGVDALMGIRIECKGTAASESQCAAEDGPTFRFLPASCQDSVTCSPPSVEASIERIHLDEEVIRGDPVDNYL